MKTSKQVLINPYFLVHILLPLIIGCGIYVLLRQSSMFFVDNWISYSLPKIKIVEFIKYNLPDGLWLYSLTNSMIVLWGNELNRQSIIWICSIPILGFLTEILQANHLFEGTYDTNDLLVYGAVTFLCLQQCKVKYFSHKII